MLLEELQPDAVAAEVGIGLPLHYGKGSTDLREQPGRPQSRTTPGVAAFGVSAVEDNPRAPDNRSREQQPRLHAATHLSMQRIVSTPAHSFPPSLHHHLPTTHQKTIASRGKRHFGLVAERQHHLNTTPGLSSRWRTILGKGLWNMSRMSPMTRHAVTMTRHAVFGQGA